MAEPDQLEIIRSAMNGSAEAFQRLVEKHQGFAYNVAYRFVYNEDDAEDIVQEAFVRLWKNLHTYRQEVKLTTWLYKIITNLCLDFIRSKHGKRRRMKMETKHGNQIADGTTPEKELERTELMHAIQTAANELTPKQRTVFILRDLEGLSVEEVTDVASMSAANIKSNLFHARQKIAEKLKLYYQINEKTFLI